MDGITTKPDGKRRLRVTFPFPAMTITVAPHKPGKLAPHENSTTSTLGKPLTTHPLHPFIEAVDDELVLCGEDSTDYLSERFVRNGTIPSVHARRHCSTDS